jgi:hypothetical protein
MNLPLTDTRKMGSALDFTQKQTTQTHQEKQKQTTALQNEFQRLGVLPGYWLPLGLMVTWYAGFIIFRCCVL